MTAITVNGVAMDAQFKVYAHAMRPEFDRKFLTAHPDGYDTIGVLAARLKRMQPQQRQGTGIGMIEYAEHAAFLMQAIRIEHRVIPIFTVMPVRTGQGAGIDLGHLPLPVVSMSLSSARRSPAP